MHVELERGQSENDSFGPNLSPVRITSEIQGSDEESILENVTTPVVSPFVDQDTAPKSELPESADGIDRELFYDHLSKFPNTEYKDIRCSAGEPKCTMYLKSCGIEYGISRMIFCDKCNIYICTQCRFPGRRINSSDTNEEPIHSSTCNNPAYSCT